MLYVHGVYMLYSVNRAHQIHTTDSGENSGHPAAISKTLCSERSEAKKERKKNNWRVALFMRSSSSPSVPLVLYTFLMAQKGRGSHRTGFWWFVDRHRYRCFCYCSFCTRNIRIRPVKTITGSRRCTIVCRSCTPMYTMVAAFACNIVAQYWPWIWDEK